MDEKPDQIIDHIEAKRDELGRNLSELESRVRETTDWRTHYERNPMLVLGAALGGGILLGTIVGGGSRSSSRRTSKTSNRKTSSPAMGLMGSTSSGYDTSRSSSSSYYSPGSSSSSSSYNPSASASSYSPGSSSSMWLHPVLVEQFQPEFVIQ